MIIILSIALVASLAFNFWLWRRPRTFTFHLKEDMSGIQIRKGDSVWIIHDTARQYVGFDPVTEERPLGAFFGGAGAFEITTPSDDFNGDGIPVGSIWRDIYGETVGIGLRFHTYEVIEVTEDQIRVRDTEESVTPIDLFDRDFFLRVFRRVDQPISDSNSPTASRESQG